jgi:hypothetical protein
MRWLANKRRPASRELFPDAAILCRLDTASRPSPLWGSLREPLTPHPAGDFGPLSGNN